MTKNQAWFDEEYSSERRIIKSIRITSGGNFQGQLIIENYSRLEKLFLRGFANIDSITIKNLNQLKECTIWDCGMKDIVIINCPQIKKLNVSNNLLTSLEFLKSFTNLGELELNISSNNFLESNLRPFSRITELTSLNVGNPLSKKVFFGTYNRFSGSLSPLKRINQLKNLDISNTNINEGLEHLPESLKKISCSNDYLISWIKGNNCSQIVQELKDYWISGNCYDLDLWRNSQHFYENAENNNQLLTWKQRHIEDVRERNSRVSELEEQIAQINVNPN